LLIINRYRPALAQQQFAHGSQHEGFVSRAFQRAWRDEVTALCRDRRRHLKDSRTITLDQLCYGLDALVGSDLLTWQRECATRPSPEGPAAGVQRWDLKWNARSNIPRAFAADKDARPARRRDCGREHDEACSHCRQVPLVVVRPGGRSERPPSRPQFSQAGVRVSSKVVGVEALAKRDQALAPFFHRSRWAQANAGPLARPSRSRSRGAVTQQHRSRLD